VPREIISISHKEGGEEGRGIFTSIDNTKKNHTFSDIISCRVPPVEFA
jgi:hypothetical protein